MQLMALKRIKRGGRTIEPGDTFDVSSSGEAKALKALRRASDVVAPPPAQPELESPVRMRAVATRAAAAEKDEDEAKKSDDGEPEIHPARRYNRRDMKADC